MALTTYAEVDSLTDIPVLAVSILGSPQVQYAGVADKSPRLYHKNDLEAESAVEAMSQTYRCAVAALKCRSSIVLTDNYKEL